GVPLKVLCVKFMHTRFEAAGITPNPRVRFAKSVMAYIFQWLHYRFVEPVQGDLCEGMLLPNGASGGVASPVPPESVPAPRRLEATSFHPADAMREIVDLGD